MPDAIKKWIMESFHKSPRETFRELRKLVEQLAFPGVPLHLITPFNTTYWWTVAIETRLGVKGNPWLNAIEYLHRDSTVRIKTQVLEGD
jgi:hypothetical protein